MYRATMVSAGGLSTDVAVKLLRVDVDPGHKAVQRLRDEGRVLARLRHPAILRVFDLALLEGRVGLVTEYVEGQDLSAVAGHIPPRALIEAIGIVAEALDVAWTASDDETSHEHPLRLVHRDVKPSNIRLGRHGEVKLLDFGIARAELPHRAETRSMIVGSVPYMAPERMAFRDSHAADVYSVGLTVLQLVSGRLPSAPSGTAEGHEERVAEALAMLRAANAPEGLVALVRRAIGWDAHTRPDARELERQCRALRAASRDEPLTDWAERHVDGILGGRRSVAGEFTGRVLEGTPADRRG